MRQKYNSSTVAKAVEAANSSEEPAFLIISEDLEEFVKYTKMCKEHLRETGEVA